MAYKTEEIQINQRTPGVTLADGVANVDSEIMTYTAPPKSAIKFRPTDFVAMYLATSVPAELAVDSLITILITDPMNRESEVVAWCEYQQLKEFTNAMSKYFIKTTKILPAYCRLVFRVLSTAAADDAQTRFTISGLLGRTTL